MRKFDVNLITAALSNAIRPCLCSVETEALCLLLGAAQKESCGAAKWSMEQLLENAAEAEKTASFACQDCGLAMVFLEIGRGVQLLGDVTEAVNMGVRNGYRDARKSVAHPLTRLNSGDNTPAVLYTEIVEGNEVRLSYLAKGAGAENMSRVAMLTPTAGRQGIIDCVSACVKAAGANPCPPVILGIGIGGTLDKAAVLSKKALLRPTGTPHGDADTAALERDILSAVNALRIGAQGLGGEATALAAHIETFPTHIGMLPVAVTLQCHSVRHFTVTL